jgi:hypothetical protein
MRAKSKSKGKCNKETDTHKKRTKERAFKMFKENMGHQWKRKLNKGTNKHKKSKNM